MRDNRPKRKPGKPPPHTKIRSTFYGTFTILPAQ